VFSIINMMTVIQELFDGLECAEKKPPLGYLNAMVVIMSKPSSQKGKDATG
jgi:hypothetical protein